MAQLGHGDKSPRGFWLRSWRLWETPPRLRWYVLVVDAAAIGLGVAGTRRTSTTFAGWGGVAVLIALAVTFEEVSLRVESIRFRLREYRHKDMTSVWTFAAAIVLPLG